MSHKEQKFNKLYFLLAVVYSIVSWNMIMKIEIKKHTNPFAVTEI